MSQTHDPDVLPPQRSLNGRWPWILLLTFVLLIALALGAGWWLRQTLTRYGVEHWSFQGLSLGLNHISLEELSLVRQGQGQRFDVAAEGIQLAWDWSDGWRLWDVRVGELKLALEDDAGASRDQATPMDWSRLLEPDSWRYPEGLPEHLEVSSFNLELPCAQGRCSLAGQLQGRRQDPERLRLEATLHRTHAADARRHRVGLVLDLGLGQHRAQLEGELALDGRPLFRLEARAEGRERRELVFSGDARLKRLPRQPWLLAWLQEWQPAWRDDTGLPLEKLSLESSWTLRLPRGGDEPVWQRLQGDLALDLGVPEGTVLPWIGAAGGLLRGELHLSQGGIERYSLTGRVKVPGLPGLDPRILPKGLNPGALVLYLNGQGEGRPDQASMLPLEFRLDSLGDLRGQLTGSMALLLKAPYAIEFQDVRAVLHSEQITLGDGLLLQQADADWRLSGTVDADGYRLALAPDSRIELEQIEQAQFSLERPVLTAQELQLTGPLANPRISGQLALASKNLAQPLLRPQAWHWQGELDYQPDRLRLSGVVRNDAGLSFQQQMHWAPGQPWSFDWQLNDLFMLAGNPLAKTLVSWPELLELERGRLTARGLLAGSEASEGHARVEMELGLHQVGGIHDRSMFTGLSGDLRLNRDGAHFVLDTDGVRIERFNQGIEVGPIQFAGSYRAPLEDPANALVHIRRLEADVLGGQVWSEPMHFNLSDQEVALPMVVRGVQLAEIFRLYRSVELEGHGQVDGLLPLRISRQGVTIASGSLRARPPGGVLQYRAERAQQLARSDARMRLIVDVLENFHFSVLASNIDYAQDGSLLLGVNLQGRNPGMVDSPPVNLNITLEENLHLLLASLQLAENVGDKIKQRVSDSLERRGRAGNP